MRQLFLILCALFALSTPSPATELGDHDQQAIFPPVTEEDAKDVVEAHLGIRPEKVDMSNVDRWGYGYHTEKPFTRYITSVRLAKGPFLSSNNICFKQETLLLLPSWNMHPAELITDPGMREHTLLAATLPASHQSCDDVTRWTEVMGLGRYTNQAFTFLDEAKETIFGMSEAELSAILSYGGNGRSEEAKRLLFKYLENGHIGSIKLHVPLPHGRRFGAGEYFLYLDDQSGGLSVVFHGADNKQQFDKISVVEILE